MSIKYFANRVKETSTTTGTGNFVLGGSVSGFKTFVSAIGSDKKLTYYIYRLDTNTEWEIGVGYIQISGGLNILVREQVVSSSNSNNFVSFGSGTKFLETIISEDRINTSLLNVVEKSGNFTPEYMPAIYVIDASVSGVQVTLPSVVSKTDPISIGFLLSRTSGNVYSQPNAVLLTPSGTETINSTGTYNLSIRNDYIEIMSVPSKSGWLTLDPIQDATNPYGDNGSIQIKYDSSFSGINKFNWDFNNSALLIGGTGNISTASVIIPTNSGSTIVFNEQSHPNSFRVEGSGNTHLLYVNGASNKVSINTSSANDSLIINSQYGNGITVYRSGVGPKLVLGNTSVSGLATGGVVGTIVFSGLNASGNNVDYGKIYSKVLDTSDSSEFSSIVMEIIKNGSLEEAISLTSSGVSLGFNNTNLDGIVIGEISQNDGTNVVIGYYHNICGENCIAIGNNSTLASGTYGGTIGSYHSSSGNNIWIIGGSGVNTSGNNQTLLALNNNNYIKVADSGGLSHTTFTSGNSVFTLHNLYAQSGTNNQYFVFKFNNSVDTAKSGVLLGSRILNSTSGSERTRLFSQVLTSSGLVDILALDSQNLNIGNSSISGNNIVYGLNHSVRGVNNSIFGSGISTSGNNNVLVGYNISIPSGSNSSIFGTTNVCENSGNIGITIFGAQNGAAEDYTTVFGYANYASGLYASAIGYNNGSHGEYSVGVGAGNLILTDAGVSVGNSNTLTALSIDSAAVAVGASNTISTYGTGVAFGYYNNVYGTGGFVLGNNIVSTGNNNTILGSNVKVTGNNNIVLSHSANASFSGNNRISLYVDSNNYIQVSSTGTIIRSTSLASSGTFVTPLYLTEPDSEYKFLYPTGASFVYLPNGTGLYLGKKFTIANMDSTYSIVVRKSGSISNIETILAGRNMTIVHAGNNNWVRIVSSGTN